MFIQMSRDDEIAAFVGDILREESADFKRRLIAALSHLDEAGWDALEQLITETAQAKDAAPIPDDPPPWTEEEHAVWEAEARAEAEEVYRQVLQEKKEAAESSASLPDLLA